MKTSTPLISVVIPTCRRNELLSRCLERLAPKQQTLPAEAYEVIVTDDGTVPDTREMVSKYYPWVRWVQGPRKGPAANRNKGASAASGKWIGFTDDDCIPEDTWLAEFAAVMEDGCDVCEGRTFTDEPWRGLFYTAPVNREGGFLWSCNFAIKSDIFSTLGGFDELFPTAHLEDVDFRMRVIERGYRIRFVPAAKVLHPQRYSPPGPHRAGAHKSSVYLAFKHGLSLGACGLGLPTFARKCLHAVQSQAGLGEKLRYVLLTCMEELFVTFQIAFWVLEYRRMARKAVKPLEA